MQRDLPKNNLNPYRKWLGQLDSYQGEIKSYQKALADLVRINKDDQVISLAKKFTGDFARKLQEIDQHLQSLRACNSQSSNWANAPVHFSSRQMHNLERFSRSYGSLKNCYQMFLSDIKNA